MAGLLDKIARQVRNSLEPRKTEQSRPKTMSQTADRRPVVVMPVKPVSHENVIITLEKEISGHLLIHIRAKFLFFKSVIRH